MQAGAPLACPLDQLFPGVEHGVTGEAEGGTKTSAIKTLTWYRN